MRSPLVSCQPLWSPRSLFPFTPMGLRNYVDAAHHAVDYPFKTEAEAVKDRAADFGQQVFGAGTATARST